MLSLSSLPHEYRRIVNFLHRLSHETSGGETIPVLRRLSVLAASIFLSCTFSLVLLMFCTARVQAQGTCSTELSGWSSHTCANTACRQSSAVGKLFRPGATGRRQRSPSG